MTTIHINNAPSKELEKLMELLSDMKGIEVETSKEAVNEEITEEIEA